jgi:hypothetical protein
MDLYQAGDRVTASRGEADRFAARDARSARAKPSFMNVNLFNRAACDISSRCDAREGSQIPAKEPQGPRRIDEERRGDTGASAEERPQGRGRGKGTTEGAEITERNTQEKNVESKRRRSKPKSLQCNMCSQNELRPDRVGLPIANEASGRSGRGWHSRIGTTKDSKTEGKAGLNLGSRISLCSVCPVSLVVRSLGRFASSDRSPLRSSR